MLLGAPCKFLHHAGRLQRTWFTRHSGVRKRSLQRFERWFVSGSATHNLWIQPTGFDRGRYQVLVSGIPAPILYAGPNQINLQVPFKIPCYPNIQPVNLVSPAGDLSLRVTAWAISWTLHHQWHACRRTESGWHGELTIQSGGGWLSRELVRYGSNLAFRCAGRRSVHGSIAVRPGR